MALKNSLRWLLLVLSLVGGATVLILLILEQGIDQIFAEVARFGFLPFVGFVAISLLNFVFYSLRWQLIVNQQMPKNERVGFLNMYLHRMGGFAVSYLTPAAQVGGEPVRIALLSTEKSVGVKRATSSVLLDIAFELSAYALFIFAGVVFAALEGVGDTSSLAIIFIGLGVMLVALIGFFAAVAFGNGFFTSLFNLIGLNKIKRLQKFEQGVLETEALMHGFLSGRRRLVFVVALLSMIVISFRVIEVFYIAHFFGVNLNFAQAFLVSTLPGIALLLPVPAGVGVFEGGFAAIFGILSIPLSAVAFAFIIRGRDLVFIVVGCLHIFLKGSKFLREKIVLPMVKPDTYAKRD